MYQLDPTSLINDILKSGHTNFLRNYIYVEHN